ncbi:MAG: hypothetical protein QOG26_314 [Solirubrobacterales bacterium]|nr:hypothetical protein [Solirubrobacterales bacterium]
MSKLATALLALSLALLLAASPAAAHELAAEHATGIDGLRPTQPLTPAQVDRQIGSEAKRRSDGLYKVEMADTNAYTLTHGPDTRQEILAATSESGFSSSSPQRRPVCATDHYQHVLYAHLPGTADRVGSYRANIQAIMRRTDAVLNRESIASGGPNADFKVLCDGAGQPRVDSVVVPSLDFATIITAVKDQVSAPSVDYTIFVDNPDRNHCGIGTFYPDDSLSSENRNLALTGFAAIYKACWGTMAPMHETAHNEGAVQPNAPHSTGKGDHCWDETDVLCYAPDGGSIHQWGTVGSCRDYEHFDCHYDDYFDSAPEAGEWLATHWNLGSSMNQSIVLGRFQPETYTSAALRHGRTLNPQASAEPGSFRNYGIRVPRGARDLKVTMSRPSCEPSCKYSLDLYLRRGGRPTAHTFSCRRSGSTRKKVCRIPRPGAGKWYAGVRSASGPGGGPFKIGATWR